MSALAIDVFITSSPRWLAGEHEKIYSLYEELSLQLRNKTPKRRVKAKFREDRATAVRSNDVRAMDSVHDQLATGRKLRILTGVATFSRVSPVLNARLSYRGEDLVATLDKACRVAGDVTPVFSSSWR